MKLHNPFKRKTSIKQEFAEPVEFQFEADKVIEGQQVQGGVIKTQQKQFNMDEKRHGGRVVKAMPKQLRHMKELSEKTDD